MTVAELGRQEGMANVGPLRITLRVDAHGNRHFRIRCWEDDFTFQQSAWLKAGSNNERISLHWGGDSDTTGANPNGFVRLHVGDDSIALEGLDNGSNAMKTAWVKTCWKQSIAPNMYWWSVPVPPGWKPPAFWHCGGIA